MRRKIWMLAGAAALLGGCGSHSDDMSAEASRYDALAHDVATATASYCSGRSWSATPEACAATVAAHQAAIASHLGESRP